MRTALAAAVLLTATHAFAEAPLSLTASDGTGLKLAALKANAVVDGPLAFTELTLTFENPADRVIEGTFHITLPPLATVSRFAMKLDGRWQEGEVVEKQAARRAYEDFLHRRQDPALLEQSGGNSFDARVFPIPARGKKELVISYSHVPVGAYVLPLKGLPAVVSLSITATVDGKTVPALEKTGWAPDSDFTAPLSTEAGKALRVGDYLVAQVKPVATSQPDTLDSVVVLFDTSASRALGFNEQIALLQKLAAGLGKTHLTLAAFDQTVTPLFDGLAYALNDSVLKPLKAERALGASNLEAALKWVGTRKAQRVILISDGVATAGAVEGDLLIAAVKGLKSAGVQRLDAIALGGLRDVATLKQLVTAGLPRDGAVIDGDAGADEALKRLNQRTFSKLTVALGDARFVWPSRIDGVQAGDTTLIVAELPAKSPLALSIDGKPVTLEVSTLKPELPMLERAVVQGHLELLQDQIDRVADGPKQKDALKAEAVKLSTTHRVLCAYTALLILETEADYARFGIDRRALADILVVRDGKVVSQKRAADSVVVEKMPPPDRPMVKAKANKEMQKSDEQKPMNDSRSPRADESDVMPALEETAANGAPAPGGPSGLASLQSAPAPVASPSASSGARAAVMPPPPPRMVSPPMPEPMEPSRSSRDGQPAPRVEDLGAPPYDGTFKQVMESIAAKHPDDALAKARGWREESPGDVLALVALGEAFEAKGDEAEAARAYGSIIDLFSSRADLRRFAGARLERLKSKGAAELALDSFTKAAEQRPDHPASHRLLAFMLLRQGRLPEAFSAIEKGIAQPYPSGRFAGVDRILREDAGLIAAVWLKAEPKRREEILQRLKKAGGTLEDKPSLRFVLNWETDANDVDFHIIDAKGGHAFYSAPHLPSGGDLYADVTTGYGPECFTIRNPPSARVYPYKLMAHYYSRGPMGYGMGKLEIIDHDGKGTLKIIERPYIVMVDRAFVDLGTVDAAILK